MVKRLNNKGFAITTIVYGLAIMSTMILTLIMSLLATTRVNNNNLSKTIEQELNRYSKTTVVFSSSEEGQEYIVPEGEAGWYRIELWGAQGGGNNGGLGAYTSGIIKLDEGDILYFVVGKQGTDTTGGGATDVRLENIGTPSSEETRIMVAAGGGRLPGAAGGTLVGYNSSMISYGGNINIDGDYDIEEDSTLLGYSTTSPMGTSIITQTGTPSGNSGSNNPGGEGYFTSTNENYGGISFISGYVGSKAYVKGALTNDAKYIYHRKDGGSYADTGRAYYFVDGIMFPGVKSGEGQARIERIVNSETLAELPRLNTKLNGVTAVRDCISKSSISTNINSIAVSVNGSTMTDSLTTDGTTSTRACKTLHLSGSHNLDEVAVYHDPGYDYIEHTIEVQNASGWQTIKGIGTGYSISETETATGVHISAYQPDYTSSIPPSGNYYIMPVTAEAKVVSGPLTNVDRENPLKINPLVGENRQKWSIELLNEKIATPGVLEYRIIELTGHNALTIHRDENIEGNPLIVSSFNNLSRNEPSIWKVTPMGDGTVTISSAAPSSAALQDTGNVFVQTNSSIADNYNTLMIGVNFNKTQRFKLIKLDY